MEQQWLLTQYKSQVAMIKTGDTYFSVEYMPVWGAISLASAALLGWVLALQKMFPSLLRDYAMVKAPNRIMQLHLDQVMMGTILLCSSTAFPTLPHFVAQPLTFGCLMNPLGFLPLIFFPSCDKTLIYRGGIGVSFISSTIGFVGLACAKPFFYFDCRLEFWLASVLIHNLLDFIMMTIIWACTYILARDSAMMAVREVLQAVKRRKRSEKKLSLMARTILLIFAEVLVNALLWIITAIVFLKGPGDGHRILGLALVAWTTGLRHGLDADHISAIDNAIRRIVSVPQTLTIPTSNGDSKQISCIRRPVTVGLLFSLGHSTIVFAATVAIAISAGVANNFDGFGNVGGIIGASISGSFLILIGCINAVILYKTVRRLQAAKKKAKGESASEDSKGEENHRFNGIITRVAMPILRSVDRPWKMYPVGVLFGLGFDTASSIALLSVAVIAQQQQRKNAGSEDGSSDASVILLALLFTAGMTLVDSADSCLMIWAYAPDLPKKAGWRERLAIWRDVKEMQSSGALQDTVNILNKQPKTEKTPKNDVKKEPIQIQEEEKKELSNAIPREVKQEDDEPEKVMHELDRTSLDASASRISLLLTLLSILVAFAIGLIVLMGLIGEQCSQCARAADNQEETGHGGLAGRWWLGWRKANDNSGYVGAGIVGTFAVSVVLWYLIRYIVRKVQRKKTSL